MDNYFHILILLGALQSFFLGILLFRKKENTLANKIYASILFLCFIALLLAYMIFTGIAERLPFLLRINEPISFLFGPLIYLYAFALISKIKKFEIKYLMNMHY